MFYFHLIVLKHAHCTCTCTRGTKLTLMCSLLAMLFMTHIPQQQHSVTVNLSQHKLEYFLLTTTSTTCLLYPLYTVLQANFYPTSPGTLGAEISLSCSVPFITKQLFFLNTSNQIHAVLHMCFKPFPKYTAKEHHSHKNINDFFSF